MAKIFSVSNRKFLGNLCRNSRRTCHRPLWHHWCFHSKRSHLWLHLDHSSHFYHQPGRFLICLSFLRYQYWECYSYHRQSSLIISIHLLCIWLGRCRHDLNERVWMWIIPKVGGVLIGYYFVLYRFAACWDLSLIIIWLSYAYPNILLNKYP